MIVVTLSFCAFQPKNRWLTCCLTEQWRKSFGNQFLADLSAVGCSLKSLCNHFVSRKLRMGTMRGRMMCPSSFLAVIWAFGRKGIKDVLKANLLPMHVIDTVKSTVASWVHKFISFPRFGDCPWIPFWWTVEVRGYSIVWFSSGISWNHCNSICNNLGISQNFTWQMVKQDSPHVITLCSNIDIN